MAIAVGGLLAVLGGCLDAGGELCAGGFICPAGLVCNAVEGCVLAARAEVCQGRPDGAECAYAEVAQGVCVAGLCRPQGCGNEIVEDDEACDDGNRRNGDGCSADCSSDESCGNGVIDFLTEGCDDGNSNDGDGCQSTCLPSTCGDGVVDVDFHEVCDDGPANSQEANAACRVNCQNKRCGDGVVDSGEDCDDGNEIPGDDCSGECRFEVCGNAVLDVEQSGSSFVPIEECDDGDLVNGDGCHNSCVAEAPRWRELLTSVPSDRSAAMAYDVERGVAVMFSGWAGGYFGDTWEWNGATWVDVTPAGFSPDARYGHAMAYDKARGQVVLFGGFSNGRLADTWLWDGERWRDATPVGIGASPSPRQGHAMVYDASRGVIVLFGGYDGQALGDTWEWDGSAWTDVTPAAPADSPAPVSNHAMAYDAKTGLVMSFGGWDGDYRRDTWVWNGSLWEDVTPEGLANSPSARGDAAMAFDTNLGQVVLFSGEDGTELVDTWTWMGTLWKDVTPESPGDSPGPRYRFALASDPARAQLVLFGGQIPAGGFVGDTWTWDGALWSERTIASYTVPTGRSNHAAAFDGARGELIVSCGYDSDFAHDTWSWDGREWRDVTPPNVNDSPGDRRSHTMAYDPSRQVIVLFGGWNGSSYLGDTWEWNGSIWVDVTPPDPDDSPSPRYGHSMSYDPVRGTVLVFGGADDGGFYGDVWEWTAGAWVDITPTGPAPTARAHHATAPDRVRNRVVLFGGNDGLLRGDTWEWDGASWTEITGADAFARPDDRAEHQMVFDAARGRVVLFGGKSGNSHKDTWEWSGERWYKVSFAAGAARPEVRHQHAMAFDALRREVGVFGGQQLVLRQDTWVFHRRGGPFESCVLGFDSDRDGALGCDDPDCRGFCTPGCPPDASCDPSWPHCGDGDCNPSLENCRLCPGDCGTCSAVCGDFLCDAGEDAASCPGDCS